MNKLRVWLVLVACVGLLALPACSDRGDDNDDDSGNGSDEPTRTPRPTRTPTPEPEFVPTFAEGGWTAGQANATISGGASATVDAALRTVASSTTGKPDYQTTRLTFANGLNSILISISTQYQPFAMAVRRDPDVYIDEGTCEVTYKATEEKRVEGSFKCTDVDVEQGGNGEATTVEGTFLATR